MLRIPRRRASNYPATRRKILAPPPPLEQVDDADEANSEELPSADELTPEVILNEEPADEVPLTEESAAAGTPVSKPVAVASPTSVPKAINWSQPAPITCGVIAGDPTALDLLDTATYRCGVAITTTTTGDIPADTAIIWIVQAAYGGDQVTLRLPQDATATLLSQDAIPDGFDARLRAQLPFSLDGQQQLTFDVVVERSSCAVGDATLALTVTPEFTANDIAVNRTDLPPANPFQLTTTAVPNGVPAISFAGPIVFDQLAATSAGLLDNISRGTATIVVSGDWNPCVDYTLYLSGVMHLPDTASATLRVVAVNNEPIPGGACVLATGCAIIALPETGNAAAPLQVTVQLEVAFDFFMLPGDYGITVTASTEAISAQP